MGGAFDCRPKDNDAAQAAPEFPNGYDECACGRRKRVGDGMCVECYLAWLRMRG